MLKCGPKREMGPASRPTPLSPACGPRRTLYARRLQCRCDISLKGCAGERRLCRPALAPAPVPSVAGFGSRGSIPCQPSVPRPSLVHPCFKRFGVVRRRCVTSAWASKSGLVDFAPSRFQRIGLVYPKGSRSVPPPRGISPSRRYGSEIPSPPLAFQPLPRKGQSPFDKLKVRRPDDSGNGPARHLSTSGAIASGQGWITPPSAAKWQNRVKLSPIALRQ